MRPPSLQVRISNESDIFRKEKRHGKDYYDSRISECHCTSIEIAVQHAQVARCPPSKIGCTNDIDNRLSRLLVSRTRSRYHAWSTIGVIVK